MWGRIAGKCTRLAAVRLVKANKDQTKMNLAIISQSPVLAPHHRPFSFPKRYQLSELIICRLELAKATGEDRSAQGGSGQDLAGQGCWVCAICAAPHPGGAAGCWHRSSARSEGSEGWGEAGADAQGLLWMWNTFVTDRALRAAQ